MVEYRTYSSESQLNEMKSMIDAELSEPYSIFTYRYFLYSWPQLTILVILTQAYDNNQMIGVIVAKVGDQKSG